MAILGLQQQWYTRRRIGDTCRSVSAVVIEKEVETMVISSSTSSTATTVQIPAERDRRYIIFLTGNSGFTDGRRRDRGKGDALSGKSSPGQLYSILRVARLPGRS